MAAEASTQLGLRARSATGSRSSADQPPRGPEWILARHALELPQGGLERLFAYKGVESHLAAGFIRPPEPRRAHATHELSRGDGSLQEAGRPPGTA